MQVLNFVIKALNDNMFCISVFYGLRKGFDVCSHDILLAKFERMGTRVLPLNDSKMIFLREW